MSLEEMHRELLDGFKEIEALCLPSQPCVRATPYGTAEGMKCALGPEVNHNTTLEQFPKIVENGELRPGAREWVLGQDAVSMSSCPSQSYSGTVKFVFDSGKVLDKLRAMCYVNFSPGCPEEHRAVEKGMSKEGAEPRDEGITGDNRVRAKYGIQPDIYTEECEYVAYEPIPLKENLKRVEFWIPRRIDAPWESNFGCRGTSLNYANVFGHPPEVMLEHIGKVREAAERLGVDFKVKSCFPYMRTGRWGNTYYDLTEENLEKLARGERPEEVTISDKVIHSKAAKVCRC